MKVEKFNKRDTRFAPWTALCLLSLLAAIVFAVPSPVFAQITGELSQECDFALIGTEHTITAKVTEDGAPGATVPMFFYSTDNSNDGQYMSVLTVESFDENGVATFRPTKCPSSTTCPPYMVNSVGPVDISLIWVMQDGSYDWVTLDTVTTTWTDNEADLCSKSESPDVIARPKLNVKKRGALKIAICNTNNFNVNDVDVESVKLVGVEPVRWKFVDKDYCPGGEDGFVDLVFKFKNQEVVKALEKALGRELLDDEYLDLEFTGSLKDADKTAIDSTLKMQVFRKGRVKKHKEKMKGKYKEKKNK